MPELKTVRRPRLVRASFLPAGTPRPIVDFLNAQMKDLARRCQDPERFKSMAGFPAYGTPEQFDNVRQCTDRAVEERDRQGKG